MIPIETLELDAKQKAEKKLFIFLDEGGNLDFTPRGTKYFTLTAYYTLDPLFFHIKMAQLKYDLMLRGKGVGYFHATEDKQDVRDEVFNILHTGIDELYCRSIIVNKCKTNPSLQNDIGKFYLKILDILIRYILRGATSQFSQILFVTDELPIQKNRNALKVAIKKSINAFTSIHSGTYEIYHHSSKADINLQIADYLNWAIFTKWERDEMRSYKLIHSCVKSEFDVFRNGAYRYY